MGDAVRQLRLSEVLPREHPRGLADRTTHLEGEVVLGCIGWRAGGTEDADRWTDVAELVEPEGELALDPAEALGLPSARKRRYCFAVG